MKIHGKLAITTIKNSLSDINKGLLSQLSITMSSLYDNIVNIDTKELLSPIKDKSFSIRLKKWVEPYLVAGINYTLFYTEVDHNYKVGDRVFIEGGVYDSDTYISLNKYKKNVDGYKVIYVDRCKVVLNIEYTGQLPTNEEEIDNFVKIYVASNQEEFEYYCQVLSMRNDDGVIHHKFDSQPGDFGTNNLLYLNGTFSTNGLFTINSFSNDYTPSLTFSNLGNSFVVRGQALDTNYYYVDITNDVLSNNFSQYLNPGWTQSLSGFYNNGKLRIMNGNFELSNIKFKNEYIYYFDGIWKIDKSYLPTIITKQHFRDGVFNKGSYNQGLYGQHEKRLKYIGDSINWNLGTTLNVDWYSGVLNSTVIKDDSYFTIFDRYEVPQIRSNSSNNGGAGYNYVFNTDFVGGDVINGNIFNMSVVYGTNSSTQSALESYLTGNQISNYSINLKGGVYYNSDIIFASVSNSTIISSYVYNSILNKVKSVNSEIENSVFVNGTWLSDKIVKIQSYEESNISWYNLNGPINYKMYKFYLTDTNWLRLREFQNFYFQDIGISIPSTELLNFFDDKFSVGNYIRTIDTYGGKFTQSVLIQLSTKEDNRNSPGEISSGGTVSMVPNDVALPSIDIFIENGDDFVYGVTNSYPRNYISDTIDISNAYILDSDFISGLFKDSKWVSGNYFNYNADYALLSYFNGSNSGYVNSVLNGEIKFTTYHPKYRRDIIGTSSQQIAFINGLYYDSNLNGGNNIVKLSDTYKINNVATYSILGINGREFYLKDLYTQSGNLNLPNFIDQQYIRTINSQNRWNYIHPTKFQNSVILSGIFRRAYFDGCKFSNTEIDLKDRELSNVSNKRKLLLSDIIFSNNNNEINSGLVQYSHFTSGSDIWNNGIFHSGIWNTKPFTYSLYGSTSSSYLQTNNNSFRNGIFRNSTWVDGTFDNGLFYKNNTNVGGNIDVFTDSKEVYYIDNPLNYLKTRFSWQNGIFKNGDFEKSNFEYGFISNANFYDSNFFSGESNGTNFGKTNLNYSKTRIWTGTFSNANVINAEFRSEDPKSQLVSTYSIIWNSGVFNSGIFGVSMPISYTTNYPYQSIWKDGIFNNGEFGDISIWENGFFNNGKFTSYYKMYDGIFPKPFEYLNMTQSDFAWQNGKFNGGEFGTGLTGNNSTWYKGEFNGGKFKGRYWRNGILTSGIFEGSGTYSTDILSYNKFIKSFNSYYYGYWQDGFVSKNKDKFIKDEKIFSEIERQSNKRKKKPDTLLKNVLWNSGTFSNFDGEMDNSVWLDGTFQDGYFKNSSFNPYINLMDVGTLSSINNFPLLGASIDSLNIGEIYTFQFEIISGSGSIVLPFSASGIGFYSGTFSATNNTFLISKIGQLTINNIVLYPGTVSGFRNSDSCIWENGELYSSDIYYSKWKQGVFDSYSTSKQGNAWGIIWENGISKYMNANNVFWNSGIWRNGNWNGSPFNKILNNMIYPGFSSDIINNIMTYASQSYSSSLSNVYNNWNQLHINDVFTFSGGINKYDSVMNNQLYLMNNNANIGSTISLYNGVDYVNNSDVYVNLNPTFSSDSVWLYGASPSNNSLISSGISNGYFFYNLSGLTASDTLRQLGILEIGELYNIVTDIYINSGATVYMGSGNNQILIATPSVAGTMSLSFIATDKDFEVNISAISTLFLIRSLKVCKVINSRFGNGQFLSGIWENGIWNEGWREDLTYITCDNLSNFDGVSKNKAYKTNIWTWSFVLNVLNVGAQSPGLITEFNIGDKVSVGNIVTIDINGNRRLIRDYLTIVGIDYNNINNKTTLTLEVNINFPIRSIEKDSDNHLIYVSRNVWLNGAFLNGRFLGGVWNNGLFRGYPYITKIEDVQWIDGVFKGGRFKSINDSYFDDNNVLNRYNTGLIQKFDFYDENVSNQPNQFKFNSWVDVNYYNTEGVNINRVNNVYKKTALGFTTSFIENNFYGYPTVDVLESNSTIRNGYDLNSRTYRLGYKWKEYTNYLDEVGEFIDINEYEYTNFTQSTSGFGISNLINDGWTFSYLSDSDGFASATNSIISNIGSYDSEWLYISGGRRGPQTYPLSSNKNFTVDIFDNTNVTIDKLRYSFIEIEAETLRFTQSVGGVVQPVVFYNNYPAPYSIAATNTLFNGNNITIPINQISTQSVVNQREFFFNKSDIQMVIFSGPTYSLRFKKIRCVETDMIPFTQIADECIQFKTNALWDTTPEVKNPAGNYVGPNDDPGYNLNDPLNPEVGVNGFPGIWGQALPNTATSSTSNLQGNLQVIPGQGLPTWDNFYLTSNGDGCISYINSDISVPYKSVAPDIDYGNNDISYIKSSNVSITNI